MRVWWRSGQSVGCRLWKPHQSWRLCGDGAAETTSSPLHVSNLEELIQAFMGARDSDDGISICVNPWLCMPLVLA